MGTQLRWLLAQGARARVVKLPTTAPIAPNAARLAEAILAEPEPCLLVAHSKGGLEALAALLEPAVAARCAGLLALHAPFHGSPVADALLARPRLHRGRRRWCGRCAWAAAPACRTSPPRAAPPGWRPMPRGWPRSPPACRCSASAATWSVTRWGRTAATCPWSAS
ncbi:lipase family protein [Teichococcus aestuarii]|uniref:hypothetical protein n=1 Tax=Teichococcus aestuarii TaxID=568898 RepID=UPI0036119A18